MVETNSKKYGFTLLELLLSMSIVAVVAVLMLASAQKIKPNKNKVMFKKAYNIISRNVSEMVNDDDLYPENEDGQPYFGNIDKVTYKGVDYEGTTKFCEIFASKMNLASDVNCTFMTFTDKVASSGQFKTTDGMVWILPTSNFRVSTVYSYIYVDVNGENEPNCFYSTICLQPDRFRVRVRQDGKIKLSGTKEKEYISATSMN